MGFSHTACSFDTSIALKDIIETCVSVDANGSELKASQLLANHTNLSQAKIKDAMRKGAVWLMRGNDKKRLRRASKPLLVGDKLELNYNAELLNQPVPEPLLIHDAQAYSIWFKPYGLHCQGSRWGDFASINRWVEINLPKIANCSERPVHLVHRLDRATTGLMLLCHSKTAARLFSAMFQEGRVDKRYQAIVQGDFSAFPQNFLVDQNIVNGSFSQKPAARSAEGERPLMNPIKNEDGKPAQSVFSCVATNGDCSLIDVKLLTGRKHQIRQHLSGLGYPIVGDRLYGDVKADGGYGGRDLQLQSVSLRFTCPLTAAEPFFTVDEHQRLQLDT